MSRNEMKSKDWENKESIYKELAKRAITPSDRERYRINAEIAKNIAGGLTRGKKRSVLRS